MGNWTRIHMIGNARKEDAERLQNWLSLDFESPRWGCLHNGGIAGLPNWGTTDINVVGNLGERDFDINDIRDELIRATAFAPSLELYVHVGDAYESNTCIHTIMVSQKKVIIKAPEVSTIPEISPGQIAEMVQMQIIQQLK